MDHITNTQALLAELGMPSRQQSELCALTILALAGLLKETPLSQATNEWMRIHDIIQFVNTHYHRTYAENSRETFRKQALHHFRTASLVEDNGKATNSPHYRWRLTEEFLKLIQGGASPVLIEAFKDNHSILIELYASKKRVTKVPIKVDGLELTLSRGKHNELQKAIIEEFAPRFAPGSICLYLGDTTRKDLLRNDQKLTELGFKIAPHGKLPDVLLYSEDKHWLYIIEAVTSVGPISPKRMIELAELLEGVSAGKIYVTAFLDFKRFKCFSDELAWETEVWIAENPEHLIHFNGDKFFGPR